jgi:hypothetical protein
MDHCIPDSHLFALISRSVQGIHEALYRAWNLVAFISPSTRIAHLRGVVFAKHNSMLLSLSG